MNIAEIRKKYPQYEDLSDQQLAAGLHKKHYSDMPFDDFSKRIGYSEAVGIQPVKSLWQGVKDAVRGELSARLMSEETRTSEVPDFGAGIASGAPPSVAAMESQPVDAEALRAAINSPLLDGSDLKRPEGFASGLAQDVLRGIPPVVGMGVATAMGTPVAGMAMMGRQVAGMQYADLTSGKNPVPPQRAKVASIANAAIQAPMEQLALGKILRLWRPGQSVVGALGAGFVTEFATEYAQKYPELLTEVWARNPGASQNEVAAKFTETALTKAFQKEAGYEGLVGGIIGSGMGGAGAFANRNGQRQENPRSEPVQEEAQSPQPETEQPVQEQAADEFGAEPEPGTDLAMFSESVKKATTEALMAEAESPTMFEAGSPEHDIIKAEYESRLVGAEAVSQPEIEAARKKYGMPPTTVEDAKTVANNAERGFTMTPSPLVPVGEQRPVVPPLKLLPPQEPKRNLLMLPGTNAIAMPDMNWRQAAAERVEPAVPATFPWSGGGAESTVRRGRGAEGLRSDVRWDEDLAGIPAVNMRRGEIPERVATDEQATKPEPPRAEPKSPAQAGEGLASTMAMIGTIDSQNVVKYPSGKYGFAGNVDDRLAFETEDGGVPTKEQLDTVRKAQSQRMGKNQAGVRSRVFDSEEEAVEAARALGYKVDAPKTGKTEPEPAETKEPWEMTLAGYKADSMPSGGNFFKQWTTSTGRSGKTQRDKNDMAVAMKAQEKATEASHKSAVEQAVREGKPVPPEVLSEYPDLAPKPANWRDKAAERSGVKVEVKADETVVSVPMPKKQSEALAPKEQKRFLLSEIDAAIGLAKAEALPPGELVRIEVPGDGVFEIDPAALEGFKKKVGREFPLDSGKMKSVVRMPSDKPTGKRVAPFTEKESLGEERSSTDVAGETITWRVGGGEDIKAYNPYVQKKQAPVTDGSEESQRYGDGFYTNGSYFIKTKKPTGVKTQNVDGWLGGKVADVSSKTGPAEIKGEFMVPGQTLVHIEGGVDEGAFRADYIDAVLTSHPGAKVSLGVNGSVAVFEVDGKVVGAVARFGDPDLGSKSMAEVESIRNAKKTPTKSIPSIVAGRSYVPIHEIRAASGMDKAEFDKAIRDSADKGEVALQPGNAAGFTDEQVAGAYTDELGDRYLNVSAREGKKSGPKLSANPMADPEVWKQAVKPVVDFFGKPSKVDWRFPDKKDIGRMMKAISMPMYKYANHPQLKKLWGAALDKDRDKYVTFREIIYTEPDGGVAYNSMMEKFAKRDKKAGEFLKAWIRESDKAGPTERIVVDEGKFYVEATRDGKRVTEGLPKESDAEAAMAEREAERFVKDGGTLEAAEHLKNFRLVTSRMYHRYKAAMDELVRQAEEDGKEPPQIVYTDENDGEVRVSIKAALAAMGDLRQSYMPRIRRSGNVAVVGRKDGKARHLEFFDAVIPNESGKDWIDKLNWASPAMRKKRELEKKGYSVSLSPAKKLPESVFLDFAGNQIAMDALVNNALKGIKSTGGDAFKRLGISWKKDGDDIVLTGEGIKGLAQDVIESHAEYEWIKTKTGGRPQWRMKGADESRVGQIKKDLDEAVASGPEQNFKELFAYNFMVDMANAIKGRGARSRMIKRSGSKGEDVVLGYEEDPIVAITTAASGLAGAESKNRMARKMVAGITGVEETWRDHKKRVKEEGGKPKWKDWTNANKERRIDPEEQPVAYDDAKNYFRDMMRNDETMDRAFGFVRGLAAVWYLGGKVSSALINGTSMLTTVPATFKKYDSGIVADAFPRLVSAVKDYTKYRLYKRGGEKAGLSAERVALFEEIEKNGYHAAQYNMEALAVLKGKVGRAYSGTADALMWMFGTTEEINRASTIAAAHDSMRAKGKSHEEAMEMAVKISNEAHGVYGKANLPNFARGEGAAKNAMRALYLFKTFTQNYYQNLAEMVGRKKTGAALYMVLAPAVLAGAAASPLYDAGQLLAWLAESMGIRDDDDNPEETFYEFMYDLFGEFGEEVSRVGLSGALAKIDLRGSLRTHEFEGFANLIRKRGDINILDALGAPGSLVVDIIDGIDEAKAGRWWKASEKVEPLFLRNISKAARESVQGVTDRANEQIWYGDEKLSNDAIDTALRVFSFNPADVSVKREKLFASKKLETKYAKKRNSVYSMFKNSALDMQNGKPFEDGFQKALLKAIEYNELVLSNGLLGEVGIIDRAAIKGQMRAALRPPKKELARESEGKR